MKINLDKISEWTFPGFKLGSLAYQYAPINAKNHFARGKDEFVIWCSNDGGNYGILLIKGEQSTFIPSPVQKKKWNNPLLLDAGSDSEEESKREPYIYYILRFDKLASLVAFVKTVNYQMETSELYKMNDQYYLTVLVDVEDRPNLYPAWLLARMREFADDTDLSRSVLQEYGQILINHDAVEGLQKI